MRQLSGRGWSISSRGYLRDLRTVETASENTDGVMAFCRLHVLHAYRLAQMGAQRGFVQQVLLLPTKVQAVPLCGPHVRVLDHDPHLYLFPTVRLHPGSVGYR
jgi:hypothetical protein